MRVRDSEAAGKRGDIAMTWRRRETYIVDGIRESPDYHGRRAVPRD